jgi:hypothetical protein
MKSLARQDDSAFITEAITVNIRAVHRRKCIFLSFLKKNVLFRDTHAAVSFRVRVSVAALSGACPALLRRCSGALRPCFNASFVRNAAAWPTTAIRAASLVFQRIVRPQRPALKPAKGIRCDGKQVDWCGVFPDTKTGGNRRLNPRGRGLQRRGWGTPARCRISPRRRGPRVGALPV